MEQPAVWPIAYDAMIALSKACRPKMEQAARNAGLDLAAFDTLLIGLDFEPQPLAAWRLRRRGPYTAAGRYEDRLRQATRLGFLRVPREGEYSLTDRGRRAAGAAVAAMRAALAKLEPLPAADLDRLAGMLSQLVDASLAAPEPPGKWCLTLSHRTRPAEDAPALVRIDQSLGDLNAYRDDAHMAAWQPSELDGADWEALTFVWRGEANTLDALAERLQRRGHTRGDYAGALAELSRRGLVVERDGAFRATAAGQKLRQSAEERTDRYFYKPWKRLDAVQIDELRGLLERLRDSLR
jgi:hypothetical protein